MPGYTDSYREGNLVANLADQLAGIERQLRELQKPTGSQKAGAVARLIEAEQALTIARADLDDAAAAVTALQARATSLEGYVQGIWATNEAQATQLAGLDGRTLSLEGYVSEIWTKDNAQDGRLDGVESRATSLEGYVQGIWAKDSAQDSAISTARSVADDAWGRANNAQARADSAYSKAENFENYTNPEIVNLTARTVALENRVRRLENFHPSV